MGRYVCRRLLGTLPVALAVSLIAFLVVNVLPGDPVQAMFGPGESVAPEVLAALRTSLGLDRSLPERYALWLGRLLRGDLGVSVRTGQPVLELIGQRVPPTLARTLRSTNAIESMISICREHSANVKRWRDGTMALRWCAAGMVEAGKQFRRVNGHLHLKTLRAAIDRHVATENVGTNRHNHTVTAA